MRRTIEAVIFDLDGVIANTVEFYYIATKKIADEIGVPFTRERNQQLQGLSRGKTVETLISESGKTFSDEQKKTWAIQKNKDYQELIRTMDASSILPGIESLLSELKKSSIKAGIASSSSNAKRVIQYLGIQKHLDHVVDIEKIKNGKPDPEIFLTAAQNLGVSPENCVGIEDGHAGLSAIKTAGMFSIGVGEHKEMEEADWHVKSTAEITLDQILQRFNDKINGFS
ncbi:beta-phosphoglucomutase [Priestia koreensis]|uniref:beta-phosphoglucomutase n=1 Tax=Priestia koreensis TaxID=284581 RepID=UPI001F58F7EE|nr:beta-phosphoglucomutase [Priestia koreensis]UNL84946.1 beta-phosphoglucomutase [Priestia koreensis]